MIKKRYEKMIVIDDADGHNYLFLFCAKSVFLGCSTHTSKGGYKNELRCDLQAD